jgi:hypothetical protein
MGFPRMLYMTGISCAGKTTLLNALRALHESDLETYDFSDLLDDEISISRDQWANLSKVAFTEAVERATARLPNEKATVLTGHVFTVLGDRRVVIQEAWDALLPCLGVVWLSVDDFEISKRRKLRERRNLPGSSSKMAEIDADAAFGVDFVNKACAKTHTPLLILPNNNLDQQKRNVGIISSLGHLPGRQT